MSHQTKTLPQISQFRSDVPEVVTLLLGRMMATDRNQRIASGDEVADELALMLNPPTYSPAFVELQPDQVEASTGAASSHVISVPTGITRVLVFPTPRLPRPESKTLRQ
jgi:hypothetical protein